MAQRIDAVALAFVERDDQAVRLRAAGSAARQCLSQCDDGLRLRAAPFWQA
jgi:hypothetical protein